MHGRGETRDLSLRELQQHLLAPVSSDVRQRRPVPREKGRVVECVQAHPWRRRRDSRLLLRKRGGRLLAAWERLRLQHGAQKCSQHSVEARKHRFGTTYARKRAPDEEGAPKGLAGSRIVTRKERVAAAQRPL